MFDDYNAYSADNRKGERLVFREFCDSVPFKFEPWFAYQYSGQFLRRRLRGFISLLGPIDEMSLLYHQIIHTTIWPW